MTPAAFFAGIVIGIFTADVLRHLRHRLSAAMATRINHHVTAALEPDDEDPLEQAWRLNTRNPAA